MTFNVSRITERLFVGGGMAGDDELDYLKRQGVTAILSVAQGLDDTARAANASFNVLYIPWLDDGTAKDEADFHRALEWLLALDAKRIAAGGRLTGLMVHCAAGVNRGPMMATFLLAATSGLPADEAWRIVKGMRPVAGAFEMPQYRSSAIRALSAILPVVTGDPTEEPPQAAAIVLTLDAEQLAEALAPAAVANSGERDAKKGK